MGDSGLRILAPVNSDWMLLNAFRTMLAILVVPGTNKFTIDVATFIPPVYGKDEFDCKLFPKINLMFTKLSLTKGSGHTLKSIIKTFLVQSIWSYGMFCVQILEEKLVKNVFSEFLRRRSL